MLQQIYFVNNTFVTVIICSSEYKLTTPETICAIMTDFMPFHPDQIRQIYFNFIT